MFKNMIYPLLIGIMIFSLIACGEKKEEAPLPEETIEDIIETVEEQPVVEDTIIAVPEPVAETPAKGDAKSTAPAAPAAAAGDHTKTPFEGYVASLDGLVGGGSGKVSKDEANAIVGRGGILVFVSGNKVYFVYNEDGSFASKRLAGFANAAKVGLLGKIQTKNGINSFIMNHIDAL